jgi:hypothetical protein
MDNILTVYFIKPLKNIFVLKIFSPIWIAIKKSKRREVFRNEIVNLKNEI